MPEDFYSIIWNEFNYDVGIAEELSNKPKVETQFTEYEEFPAIHFPGFGILKIVFLPEEQDGEETF